MFEQMVSQLQKGMLPDHNTLRKRFDAAMVKKLGVLKTPYPFWPADAKINPAAKELLWAAILLQDSENCRVVEAVISSELEEQQKARGQPESIHSLGIKTREHIQAYLQEFIDLGPNEAFKEKLRHLVDELFQDS